MKNTKRILALLLVAAAGTQCLTGCGDKKKKSSSSMPLYAETAVETPTEPPVGGAEISGDNYNPVSERSILPRRAGYDSC